MNNYKRAYFESGFNVSIQAKDTSYCTPRDNEGPYTEVELGFPNALEPLIAGYAEDPGSPLDTVYSWVPAGVITALMVKHGKVIDGEIPPLDMDAEQSAILAEILLEIENESG